jgi:16S rRNA (cytosine1402-N4)-methyltransferase
MSLPTHTPVLLKETVRALSVQPGGRYIDCTIGGGGHATAIMENSSPGGQLLGIDADPEAVKAVGDRLADYGNSVLIVNDNFTNLEAICIKYDFLPVNGILFDLGLSSTQLASGSRGFSFQQDAHLDMRFDPGQKLTAADIVNDYSESELACIIREYGEENYSSRIARRIIAGRPVKTTFELAMIVGDVVGPRRGRIHPATRTFQALRIAVNNELRNLETALKQAVNLLGYDGRLVVISYHSLEDRIIKRFCRQESRDCICPPDIPVCRCQHSARLRIINRKVITPSAAEVEANPRARSARMRMAERVINEDEWRESTERLSFLNDINPGGWRKPIILREVLGVSSAPFLSP